MAAPIGHGIELDAVRELHLLAALELVELALRPDCTPMLGGWPLASLNRIRIPLMMKLAKLYGGYRREW